ncbi:CVNH domain-containing protein [Aquabacter sp. CN5-332]|uniref:CVNH domain-containing protein n=1 Tax=Aquabacter sp. CN5-332 TaxID=3156608 RepID=UPI0032B4E541
MRVHAGIFALAAWLLGLVVLPASAQQIPPGSYLSSCRDVREVAGWLKATCQDGSGGWVEATTAIGWCAPGKDIANENGRLVCKSASSGFGGSSSFGERPPSGSYMSTCRDIRMVAGWLKATCQDSRGKWVDATTAASWCTTGRDIANVDGQLTCR